MTSEAPDLIERMAIAGHAAFQAAIAPSLGDWFKPETWDGADHCVKLYYRAAARANLEVLREPGDAVICAVENKAEERYNAAPDMMRWYGEDVWAAGIDAALVSPTKE